MTTNSIPQPGLAGTLPVLMASLKVSNPAPTPTQVTPDRLRTKRPKNLDVIGERYGRLVVTAEGEPIIRPNGTKARKVVCLCDCGNHRTALLAHLRNGGIQSCGCIRREVTGRLNKTHGKTATRNDATSVYNLWLGIKHRAVAGTGSTGHRYAGRGISMFGPWIDDFLAFEAWILGNLGERKNGQSLDRINNDGNYEPGNLRWATQDLQANNTRTNVAITYNGETYTVAQWAKLTSQNYHTLWCRLFQLGWPIDRALTTPAKQLNKRTKA